MSSSSTIQLLNTIEWSKKLNFGRRANLGNYQEPAMTSANIILQTITGAPFAWRWNRVVTGFVTVAGQQDYTLFNYLPSTAVKLGWYTVDDAGNSQVCVGVGTTGSSAPNWNHTKTGATNDGTVTWTNMGPVSSDAAGSYTVGWIETTSVKDATKWTEIQSKINLSRDSAPGRPGFVSAQSDDGLGNVTFRMMPVPDAAYAVSITLQQKPPLFTKTSQTWSPIPDEFSRIFSWGFLSLMWLFSDDPRFSLANTKFVTQLLGASEGLTETQRNIFLNTWQAQTGQPVDNSSRMNQGIQARGT